MTPVIVDVIAILVVIALASMLDQYYRGRQDMEADKDYLANHPFRK